MRELYLLVAFRSQLPLGQGPVISFVSVQQGMLFADVLGEAVLEEDGEVVEGLFPVVDGPGPLA
jgi:hypothetical protein